MDASFGGMAGVDGGVSADLPVSDVVRRRANAFSATDALIAAAYNQTKRGLATSY